MGQGKQNPSAAEAKLIRHERNYGRSRASQEVLKAYSEVKNLLEEFYGSLDRDEQFYLVRNDLPHDLDLKNVEEARDKVDNEDWGLKWCRCSLSAGDVLEGSLAYERDKEKGGLLGLKLEAKEPAQVKGGQPYFLSDGENNVSDLKDLDQRLEAIIRDNSPLTNPISRWWQKLIED